MTSSLEFSALQKRQASFILGRRKVAGGLDKVSHYSFVLVSSLCRRLCVLLLIEFVYIARKFDVCKLGEWEGKRRKILFEKFSASLSMMVEK